MTTITRIAIMIIIIKIIIIKELIQIMALNLDQHHSKSAHWRSPPRTLAKYTHNNLSTVLHGYSLSTHNNLSTVQVRTLAKYTRVILSLQ